ncbi:hypothetical protein MHYP_G00111540 [Metynnis hypsauchen]
MPKRDMEESDSIALAPTQTRLHVHDSGPLLVLSFRTNTINSDLALNTTAQAMQQEYSRTDRAVSGAHSSLSRSDGAEPCLDQQRCLFIKFRLRCQPTRARAGAVFSVTVTPSRRHTSRKRPKAKPEAQARAVHQVDTGPDLPGWLYCAGTNLHVAKKRRLNTAKPPGLRLCSMEPVARGPRAAQP